MRPVIVQQYAVSLDGFSCPDDSEFQKYVFGVEDPELDEYFLADLRRAGTHVMGRVTYENMSAYWPGQENAIAGVMNGIPKVVFSRTLEHADWPESRIASGDTAHELALLKAEPGGEILVHGGYRFTQSLVQMGLVDEIRLYVFPVALGSGQSLFGTLRTLTKYSVSGFRVFSSGAVLQRLRPATIAG